MDRIKDTLDRFHMLCGHDEIMIKDGVCCLDIGDGGTTFYLIYNTVRLYMDICDVRYEYIDWDVMNVAWLLHCTRYKKDDAEIIDFTMEDVCNLIDQAMEYFEITKKPAHVDDVE